MFFNANPRLLITVPLLALPLALSPVNHANAAGGAAEEALRILARARTSDDRCNILSGAERSELSRYAARAEVAAVSQSGASAARKAAAQGVAQGQAGNCSEDVKVDVRETLEAAREAVGAAQAAAPEPKVKTTSKVGKSATRKPAVESASRGSGSGLARYERAVQAYYLERECRSLSKSEQGRFWEGIVRLHKSVVAANGASKVEPVMRKAERQAGNSGCGRKALARIRDGYSEILSR